MSFGYIGITRLNAFITTLMTFKTELVSILHFVFSSLNIVNWHSYLQKLKS